MTEYVNLNFLLLVVAVILLIIAQFNLTFFVAFVGCYIFTATVYALWRGRHSKK